MSIVPLYRDLLAALPQGPAGAALVVHKHRPYFDGLSDTYGPEFYGGQGPVQALMQLGPVIHQHLLPAPHYRLEQWAQSCLERIAPLLPTALPDLILGTLLFMAPAATIDVGGRPTMALGLERFHPNPSRGEPRGLYHPSEAEEMVPHEAAHCARMEALGLAPTPRKLSLLDMVMLEGTALTFTDVLLGRQTLATFMPQSVLASHAANDGAVRTAVAARFGEVGMPVFTEFFATGSPVSGYYAGYSYCKEYLERFGVGAMRELLALPSNEILARLSGDR